MPDFFGLLEVPLPAPANPRTEAVGDPLLDLVASYFKAVLNADLGEAWAEIYPARSAARSPSLPVMHTETFDPNEGAFTTERTPCLYVFRAEEPAPQRIRTTQSWEVVRSPIALLLVPPPPTQDKQKLRTNMRNAIDKSIRSAVRRGRHPAWVVSGDTYYDPVDVGSVFLHHAKLQAWHFTAGGVKRVPINVEDDNGNRNPMFYGMVATILVDESLERGTDGLPELSHVQGDVIVGEGAITFGSYRFQPSLLTCTPSTGGIAGGTDVTLTGHQFTLDENDAGLTIATSDGVELENVVMVDESTITATMPAHAAGLVGLVATMPSGATAELDDAFTYA